MIYVSLGTCNLWVTKLKSQKAMYSSLTRRGFLKLSGAAFAAFGIPLYPPGGNPYLMTPSLRLGRTTIIRVQRIRVKNWDSTTQTA